MHLVFWEVLDCVGRDFPKSWNGLYAVLTDTALASQREEFSSSIIARWSNHSEGAWNLLPKVLDGEQSQRDLRGFCPYGYCSALHYLLHSSQDEKLVNEFRACASWGKLWWPWNFLGESRWSRLLSPADLLHVHSGKNESWLAALAQSSPGHFSSQRHLPPEASLLEWARLGRMVLDDGCEEKRKTTSPDLYLSEYAVQLKGALAALPSLVAVPFSGTALPPTLGAHVGRASRAEMRRSSTVLLAAFGVHFTTLLEPVSALRQVLPRSIRLAAVFYGSTHPPPEPIIQEVCPYYDEDAQSVDFQCFLSNTPGNDFWHKLVDRPSMSEAATHLSGVLVNDEYIRKADFVICGGGQSPTLCLLMRMVTSMPMLFTLQAPLSFRMPSDRDQRALLVALFREMAPATLALTSSAFLQRQVWVQTGCLIPVVRNHNWYAALVPGRWGDEHGKEDTPHEIVFWQNHVALKSDCSMAVWRFFKQVVQSDFPFNIAFKNVRNLPGAKPGRKVYALRNQDTTMLSFGAMRKNFLGAVLFPHDLGMFSFDDLYALGVPLFLPDDELITTIAFAQLASTQNYPWYLLREEHAALDFKRGDSDASLPWDPGWQGIDAVGGDGRATWLGRHVLDVERLLESMTVSNFKLYPHIRRFRSLVGLLQVLGCLSKEDLLETGEAMRRSAKETWSVTADYYRRVVRNFLGVALP